MHKQLNNQSMGWENETYHPQEITTKQLTFHIPVKYRLSLSTI
jgi:hypothetical protein